MKTDKEVKPTNFWNLSTNNIKESKDFFATRDVNKQPLSDISFASNIESKAHISIPEKPIMEIDKGKEDVDENGNIPGNDSLHDDGEKDAEFCGQLVKLNTSVLDWIKQHVEENPYIDLTPVINDYEKYLKDIDAKHEARKEKRNEGKFLKTPEPTHPSPVISASGKTSITTFISSTPIQKDESAPKIPPAGFFALPANPPEKIEPVKEVTSQGGNEDAPPVVERKTIVEEDAIHQIRCRLYFKKGQAFQELGVGMLYVKPCGEKLQLLVRMEAVTGKVLLNIMVTKELPITRTGKNNLMVVTVPNPPVYAKPAEGDNSLPCTYLIRVKGTTEADELFSILRPDA